jgi:hypothetical protein
MMAYSRGSSASPIVFDVLLIRIARDVDNLRCSIRRLDAQAHHDVKNPLTLCASYHRKEDARLQKEKKLCVMHCGYPLALFEIVVHYEIEHREVRP